MCLGALARADVPSLSPTNQTEAAETKSFSQRVLEHIGLSYFSVFSGPGLGQPLGYPPGMNGAPSDTGLNFFNLVSLKYKLSDRYAIDLQFRGEMVVTNKWEYRHQGQRLGVSGDLLKGDHWKLSGAFNTDIPIPAIMGQIPSERTLIFDPGLFAFFSYEPPGSKWSLFALLQPRIWFYRDRQALAVQDVLSGGAVQKPEYDIYFEPTLNYAVTPKFGLRTGVTFEWTKFVGFNTVRRNYMPIELGFTYELSPKFSVYTQLLCSTPLDDGLREAQGFGNTAWWKSTSINLWLSGTLL